MRWQSFKNNLDLSINFVYRIDSLSMQDCQSWRNQSSRRQKGELISILESNSEKCQFSFFVMISPSIQTRALRALSHHFAHNILIKEFAIKRDCNQKIIFFVQILLLHFKTSSISLPNFFPFTQSKNYSRKNVFLSFFRDIFLL